MKIHVRALTAIRAIDGLLRLGTIGDGQALKRVGDLIVGADLTAEEVDAVPDTHDNDDQIPYYSGGWGNLDVGATGRDLVEATTPLIARTAISAARTWQKTAAPTVNDDSADGYAAGDLWNDTTNNRTYIADSVAVGAADWRSLLPVTRIVADISGGAWRAAGYASANGAWIRVTDYIAPSYTQDPETWGFSLSGTDVLVTTGAGIVNTVLRTEAPGWGWALSAFGVTTPANQRLGSISVAVSSITLTSPASGDHNGVVGTFSTASDLSTGALYVSGLGKPSTNYSWIRGESSGLPSAYSSGPNLRRTLAPYLLPLIAGAEPDYIGFDSGGSAIAAGGTHVAVTSSGTPTHIGVFLFKIGTPRAGTISAPVVTWDLGT